MTETNATTTSDQQAVDRFFGFLVGLYVAALVAPASAIAVALGVTTDPGMSFFVLLGTATVVIAGVGWLARPESLAVGLGGTRWAWLTVVPPFAYAVLLLGSGDNEAIPDVLATLPGVVVGLSMAGFIVGMMVALGLVVAANNRYTKARLSESTELACFRARAPERDRRITKRVVAGMVVVGLAGFVGAALLNFEPLRFLFQMLAPIGGGLYGTIKEEQVTIINAGLAAGTPANRRFFPWSNFESYTVTEEAIVVHRPGWSAWGLRDVRWDVNEVEDVDGVASALGQVLPRSEP